ncbi:MAG: DUF480 domain-containing protein [Acidimicrobiales bacterium]
MTITPEGGRVLGCLVEKQLATPQQYPLTLNALSLACSQSTNREPVMALDGDAALRALAELKELHLVRFVLPSHGKSVTRYRHVLDEAYGLDTSRLALLAVLLLRGPQTPGELRARTARLAELDSVESVQSELEVLAGQPEPLVHLLPRRPGQKEDRWQQLLAVEPVGAGATDRPEPTMHGGSAPAPQRPLPVGDPHPGSPPAGSGSGDDRTGLEDRVDLLSAEVAALRDQVAGFSTALVELRRSLGESD